MRIICIITCLPLLFGCQLHRSFCLQAPRVIVPEQYSTQSDEGVNVPDTWWTEFGSEQLNRVVSQTLEGNLNLRESWAKIAQACARLRIEGAARLPSIDLQMSGSHFSGLRPGGQFGAGGGSQADLIGTGGSNFYTMQAALSYEIDLWRRVESKTEAACYELQATREDLDATALTLTGTVVDLWLTIQEQKALLEVIKEQEQVSRTLLELVELRFSTALSTALDVFQQRLQLADILAHPPPIQSRLETSIHNLQTLMGVAPGLICLDLDLEVFKGLPPFPEKGAPVNLICRRPDLRAQYFRLQAADAEVAAAIADIFPRIDTFFSYGFSAISIEDFFKEQVKQVILSLVYPLFDGGRRSGEISRRKAILCEEIWRYANLFLNAMREVEDALVQEKYQFELIQRLEEEIGIAKQNLDQSRFHYINGLTDYLSVITAIQSLQNLQRQIVSERKQLLEYRANLYRALGGRVLC